MISRNFGVKYRKKFLLDNEITNDLKSIYSEIGKKYFFEFDAHHVHIFVGVESI